MSKNTLDNEKYLMIEKEIVNNLKTARRSHDLDHTWRVQKMCQHIGEIEKANLAILQYAALIHDIARELQDQTCGEICHAERGALMAEQMLTQYKLPASQIEQIVHCIATHRFRGNKEPQSLEAKVLYDADKLDGIGAIGIGRAFVFAGENGARVHNKEVDFTKTESYSVEDTAWREYMVKLRFVKDKMLTREGKRIADSRHDFMVEFFNRLNDEVDGHR